MHSLIEEILGKENERGVSSFDKTGREGTVWFLGRMNMSIKSPRGVTRLSTTCNMA